MFWWGEHEIILAGVKTVKEDLLEVDEVKAVTYPKVKGKRKLDVLPEFEDDSFINATEAKPRPKKDSSEEYMTEDDMTNLMLEVVIPTKSKPVEEVVTESFSLGYVEKTRKKR